MENYIGIAIFVGFTLINAILCMVVARWGRMRPGPWGLLGALFGVFALATVVVLALLSRASRYVYSEPQQ